MRKKPKPNKKRSKFNPIQQILNEMDKIFEVNRESETLSEEDFKTYKSIIKKDFVGFVEDNQQKRATREKIKWKSKQRIKPEVQNSFLTDPVRLSTFAKDLMDKAYEIEREENL